MKRFVAFVAIAAVALFVVAMPAFAISGVSGSAFGDNTILKVRVGNTVVKLGSDVAESLNLSSLKAYGQFIGGSVGSFQLPKIERSATSAKTSGTKSIGTGTKSVAGLASVNILSGLISTNIEKSKINSAVDFTLGAVNALNGFTNLNTTKSSTDSTIGTTSSVVSRDVTIGAVDVLDLRSLLDQLGVDPLAMACTAVAATGASLGVDTAVACGALNDVNDEITSVTGGIASTETVLATLETLLAPICALAPAGTCTTVLGQINTLQSDIDDVQANPASTCAAIDSTIDDLSGQVDGLIATLNALSGGALPDISALIAPVTSQLTALGDVQGTLMDACNTLLGLVDDLLDTPLLSLSGIKVAMDLAAKTVPQSSATGSIGALKVGNLTVVDANDLVALGGQLNAAIDTVESTLATVFGATGLDLPNPALKLLDVSKSKGRKSNGTYFANAALTVARLYIPAATVDVPSAPNNVDVLAGLGGFSPASVKMSAVSTPVVQVEAGVFSGAATFKASSSQNAGGGQLPVTGVADSGLAFAGMLTLIGAGLARRFGKAL
jgi:hypothetical protein